MKNSEDNIVEYGRGIFLERLHRELRNFHRTLRIGSKMKQLWKAILICLFFYHSSATAQNNLNRLFGAIPLPLGAGLAERSFSAESAKGAPASLPEEESPPLFKREEFFKDWFFNASAWMDRVVEREFALFEKRGITRQQLEATWDHCEKRKLFNRYKIIAGKVYGAESKIKHLLEAVAETYPVPDVDFIYFNEDRLTESFFRNKRFVNSVPIFVSAKERSLRRAILFCDWYYNPKDENNEWNRFRHAIDEHRDRWSWSEKIEKIFWRGSTYDGRYTLSNWTTIPRGRAVFESKLHPELIDAAFTLYPDWSTKDPQIFEREVGIAGKVSIEDHLQYKYQLIIDGVTSPFTGTFWRLYSGCLPFKQETKNIMFFFDEMIPWKHYIPVKQDCSDLFERVLWAKSHDQEAQEIARNAREFAETHCMKDSILLYCYKALVHYASLQKFKPTLTPWKQDREREF